VRSLEEGLSRARAQRARTVDAGAEAERSVEMRLCAEGWSLLASNWRGGGGELDRVMRRGEELRFVEVKLRAADDVLADEAVSRGQRSRLRAAARAWLDAHPEHTDAACAFLVVWVLPDGAQRWLDDAFDG
jgi:putative endonuclease